MSAETFAEDRVKLRDVLENDYYLIHELVEINEWKKRSRIHGRIVVDSPATLVYTIHYIALEKELEYALQRGDYAWIKERIRDQSEDPYMPEEFKPQAKLILEKFIKILKEESLQSASLPQALRPKAQDNQSHVCASDRAQMLHTDSSAIKACMESLSSSFKGGHFSLPQIIIEVGGMCLNFISSFSI
jgi:hypothetical protein